MKTKFLGVCVLLVLLFSCVTVPTAEQHEEQTLNFVVMGDNRPANVFRPEQPYIYHKVIKKAVEFDPVLILNTGDLVLGYDAYSQEKAREEFDDFEKPQRRYGKKIFPCTSPWEIIPVTRNLPGKHLLNDIKTRRPERFIIRLM